MYTGDFDPLRDECLRFLVNLQNNNIKSYLTEFKYMPHGFLNYGVKGIFKKESEFCINYILDDINKDLNNL